MISSVCESLSSSLTGEASQRSTSPSPISLITASRCSWFTDGHGFVGRAGFGCPGVHANALDRSTARQISFSVTTRPRMPPWAGSSTMMSSPRMATPLGKPKGSLAALADPLAAVISSRSRTNCGSCFRAEFIAIERPSAGNERHRLGVAESSRTGQPLAPPAGYQSDFFEQQVLGLFAHAGADLVNEFECIEELTARNRDW